MEGHRGPAISVHDPSGTSTRPVAFVGEYAANPTRFGNRRPTPPQLPTAAWINEPLELDECTQRRA